MSHKRRQTIRSPHFRKGAGMNAMRVDKQMDRLVKQKKDEILSLLKDLQYGRAIKHFVVIRDSRRALDFRADISVRDVDLRFIIWTDNREKPSDFKNSQLASFVLRPNESLDDIRLKVLKYLDSIEKGRVTEWLYGAALEKLEQERIVYSFHKTGGTEDRDQKKDFIIYILKDGLKHEVPLQVKSSEEMLMAVKDELLRNGIAGSFYSFTGDIAEDVDAIKKKIVQIINDYKEGKVSFL